MKSTVTVVSKFFTTLIILSIVSCNASPPETQDVNSDKNTCEDAIASVKSQLEKDRQLTIEISRSQTNNSNYADYPQDRPDSHSLKMSGNAANSTMNSDALLNSVTTQIINSCDSVGRVTFVLDKTHYVLDYGLMSDGKVKRFQCPEGFDVTTYTKSPQWGEACRA